jgi:[ribosomal protein S18]-alanine N-acetyltransferase
MGFAEVGRLNGFAHTLETRVEDMETAWHRCYINDIDVTPSMAKTVIRHAVTADFDTLLKIDQASFAGDVAYNAAELAYFMNRDGAETLVLEEDKKIVAFIVLEVHENRRSGTIITLDVLLKHRRSGYATQLLQRAEAILSDYGVEGYNLQVDVTNRAAISFYKKHGLRIVRTLRHYYANGNDAYLMVKELP